MNSFNRSLGRVARRIFLLGALLHVSLPAAAAVPPPDLAWPRATREHRPWAYWWWMGSAVDAGNLTRELERYRAAGLGGVHIIPIYGAKGWEDRALPYLGPAWMDMLRHTVSTAERLDLGVDLTLGTGWCFGGPGLTDLEANASVRLRAIEITSGQGLPEKLDQVAPQALMAFGPDGSPTDLTSRVGAGGAVDWQSPGAGWRVYVVTQRPSGQKVKRAAPGGEGPMLNLLYPAAMTKFLGRFTEALAAYDGPRPRGVYHDSYEYKSDWAPDLFAQFERRRGYRLQDELPALFATNQTERSARVKTDYRETVSDLQVEETMATWAAWARAHGLQTRNEAHGSPGNLLDLYALADIPETEMFRLDREPLIAKFASSAAHVVGRRRVAAETGTWLKEHFTETLADLKWLFDDMLISGVNHLFYHGTCYSPDEAPWPGWVFYASTQMNPRNPIWRDAQALNTYAERCQSVLQSGEPDHDVLVYWPIHDFWAEAGGLLPQLSVHTISWFKDRSIGRVAERLWMRGWSFDYISDRQLGAAVASPDGIKLPGGAYRTLVVPDCRLMPPATLEKLIALAEGGATVIFEVKLPEDVPGLANLEVRRERFKEQIARMGALKPAGGGLAETRLGRGRVLAGALEASLTSAQVAREPMADWEGLKFIRRRFEGGRHYFIANRGEQSFATWVPLAMNAQSAVLMDPLTGQVGRAALRQGQEGVAVFLDLPPGSSVIVRAFERKLVEGVDWPYWRAEVNPRALTGPWQVTFLEGGQDLPASRTRSALGSWTTWGDETVERFCGTARYVIEFEAEGQAGPVQLDLGRVSQSARVRLNGRDLATLIAPPFRVVLDRLQPTGNRLEVEVTSVAANRIRDLDRRGVAWRTFHDINFVNQDYKPFDASNWPIMDAGLLGPVTLTKVAIRRPIP